MDHPENDAQYAGLAVNKGIEQPPIVNPYLKKMRTAKRRSFTASEYVEGIVKGDTSILSQAVTLVESNLYEHQSHRKMSAPCLRVGAGGYYRRTGSRQEHIDRYFRVACTETGWEIGCIGDRPQ